MKIIRFVYQLIKKNFIILNGLRISVKTVFHGKREKFSLEPEKKVLIMGNGPSLKTTDIEKLAGEVTDIVCVNYFPLKDERFFPLKPGYLCLLDPAFFTKSADSLEKKKNQMVELLEKVDWPLKIITIQNQKISVKNANISYSYLCLHEFMYEPLERFCHFLYKHNLANFGYQNVVIGAGFYFTSKGVKEIYLAGVDMSEFKLLQVDEENYVYVNAQHHYGNEKIKHSDLGIIQKGEFYKLLGCYVKMFEQFHYLERYAQSQGVKIYNLTPDSFIDVFEKNTDYLKGN